MTTATANSLASLFARQKRYVDHFFDHLDIEKAEEFFELLVRCEGNVFISGVGKSGIVAKKIAATMVSTGTSAAFLSPTDALHGDIGAVSDKDLFILISKSGESDELLALLPFLRNKGATLVAWVSKSDSRLARGSDHVVLLPLERELCPFGLAPTTSAAIQLLFGDVMAVALMEAKAFSLQDYAMNHPSGSIGKRISLRVNDLMLTLPKTPLCGPNDILVNTLVELSNKRCGAVLMTDADGVLMGIFTDGDLRRALQEHGSQALHMPMRELVTKQPKSIALHSMAIDALTLMEADQKKPVMVLPVVDENDRVAGIVRLHDLVQSGI